MRADLSNLPGRGDHAGLAYDVLAPLNGKGEIPDDRKADWLEEVANIPVPDAYKDSYHRWERSFGPRDRIAILKLDARLLVGHGNPAPTEVGLALHHTWGAPIIPGSSLKGLCAHYVETCYGPDNPDGLPWEDVERGAYQGVKWDGNRIVQGPGEVYRALFGAPDADNDDAFRKHEDIGAGDSYPAGASEGLVTFHDALYRPGSCRHGTPPVDCPLAPDVLTVHQKSYYDAADQKTQPAPNDYDDPNPVGFLTVRPGAEFRLALSGPAEWVALAEYFLSQALSEWGIGGKTAAGYGYGSVGEWQTPEPPSSPVFGRFMDWLQHPTDESGGSIGNPRTRIDYIHANWAARLMGMPADERLKVAEAIQVKLGNVSISRKRAKRQSKLLECLASETPAPDCAALEV